ncbi:MAG: anti-sigma factor family protein [Alphaproteobacteria bacterium]
MTGPDSSARDELHAYVDDRLGPEAQSRVEARLAQHPDDAAAVHAYRLQNRALRAAFAPVIEEPLPPELQSAVTTGAVARPEAAPRVRLGWARLGWMAAASVVLLLAGGAGGWLLHGWRDAPGEAGGAFAEQALGAHRVFVSEVRHPVEVGAEQEAHLVAWLSKRLGTKLRAPNVRAAGFELVGGRLLAEGARPVAQLMYEDDGGRRLTIYLRAIEGAEQTAFRFVEENGVAAFYWIDEDYAYALIAPLERERLLDIAQQVYRDLER